MILNEIKKIDLEPYLEKTAHTLVWERIGPQLRAIPLLGSFVNDGVLAKFEVIARAEIKNEAGPLIEKVATQFEASVDPQRNDRRQHRSLRPRTLGGHCQRSRQA